MAYKRGALNQLIRKADEAVIPEVGSNKDYQEFLAWKAGGNVEDAYVPPAAIEIADVDNLDKVLKAICLYFGQQVGKTPAQVKAGIIAAYKALP